MKFLPKNLSQKFKTINKRQKITILIVLNLICIISLGALLKVYGPLMYYEIKYAISSVFDENVKNSKKYYADLPTNVSQGEDFLSKSLVKIPKAKDPKFSVVIPKLDINQRVVSEVDIANPDEVKAALKDGIGWAKGTVIPGDEGNSLLFSHSTRNAWDIWRYNSEFTLLRKLEINDFFTVVYEDRQLDFIVFEKKVVPADDISYVTSVAKGRVVTLQTCDPPGSNENRLLIRGRLVARESK